LTAVAAWAAVCAIVAALAAGLLSRGRDTGAALLAPRRRERVVS